MSRTTDQTLASPTSSKGDPIASGFASLESTLLAQETCYRRLRELVGARREAIRTADLELLKTTLDEERLTITRVAELDRTRTEIATSLAKRLGAIPAQSREQKLPPVSTLASKAPSPLRDRILALAERLRIEIEAVRHESSLVRNAAETLAQHVAGILQSVSSAFATTKTYGRGGRFATAAAIRSIDIKS